MSESLRTAKPGARLHCESLEDRATPALALALGGTGLLAFDTSNPADAVPTPVAGVHPDERLVGLDFNEQDGTLYGLGVSADANTATLYQISVQTASTQATAVGPTGGVKFVDAVGTPVDLPDPDAAEYDLDFDPVTGTIRVVTANGLNFRVDPTGGGPIDGDTGLAGSVNGINTDGAINGLPVGSTGVNATASAVTPAGASKQYTLDAGSNALFVLENPNSGTQTQRVDVTVEGNPLDFTRAAGFDISADGAFAALTVNNVTRLYQIDLDTGAATDLGATPSGIAGLVLAPPAGTIAFSGASFVATESGPGAEITLTRTGGTVGQVAVGVTATGDTATADADFQPGPYVVTFAPGQDTATLIIPLAGDDVAEPDESLTLALSPHSGVATIGAQATATLTITEGTPSDPSVPPVPPSAPPVVPTGPGIVLGMGAGGGEVSVLNADRSLRTVISPYGQSLRLGVRVATGDVTGDGVADVITAPAVGAPHVKVFDGATGAEVRSFMAYDPSFSGGLSVAAGDVNGDGRADIVTAPATGAPHVKVFDGATGAELRSFFAFDAGFLGGLSVAAGDVNGDGLADIVTGTATGSSHVKVFDGNDLALLQSTFAFVGYAGGITVAAGDVNGDGRADIVTGTAAGSSHVKVFGGMTGETLFSSLAFPGYAGGITVAARDTNGDGQADILVGTAASDRHVVVFDGATAVPIDSFFAFGFGYSVGVFVA